MRKAILPNGLNVLYKKKEGNSVSVQVMVKVGSNQEKDSERGIAHFLEHILFEGTTSRPTNRDIANEIERIGGEFNAYTTNERTCFYIKVLKKHFAKAVEILGDILQNSQFLPKHIEKEKNVVLKEMDMIYDEPTSYQWILLQQNLFTKHPARFPTYGDRNIIKGLTPKQVRVFFAKHYIPNNMTISVVGDVNNWKKEVAKRFTKKKGVVAKRDAVGMQKLVKNKLVKHKRNTNNSFFAMGFKTVPRKSKDSYVLDLIDAILGRGQSGKLFVEIRSKLGLAYEVGTDHTAEISFGMFAAYAIADKKNATLVRDLILRELKELEHCSQQELDEAKTFIEGSYLLGLEDVQKKADYLCFWDHIGDATLIDSYIKNIKKVSVADVRRVVKKYFTKHTIVMIVGK